MNYFLCKLVPPRSTFAQDMTEQEARAIQEHVEYWMDLAEKRIAVAFGPVADPKGTWGLGIIEVESLSQMQALSLNDPAVKSNIGFQYEIYQMPRLVSRG